MKGTPDELARRVPQTTMSSTARFASERVRIAKSGRFYEYISKGALPNRFLQTRRRAIDRTGPEAYETFLHTCDLGVYVARREFEFLELQASGRESVPGRWPAIRENGKFHLGLTGLVSDHADPQRKSAIFGSPGTHVRGFGE